MGTELLLLLLGVALGAETIEEAALVAVLDDRQPVVQVARAELARAAGARLGAAGAFDVKIKGKADSAVAGYYDWSAVEIAAEQQIPGWGARVGAGSRASDGPLPVYYAERETAVQGEIFASLSPASKWCCARPPPTCSCVHSNWVRPMRASCCMPRASFRRVWPCKAFLAFRSA